MSLKLPKLFYYLLGSILILNLLQANFTELIFDEAYYWHYAKNLAWGYFDHPPMVALMIKIGSYFFDGELGVRFVSCLLSAGTFILLWLAIDNPNKKKYVPHFFALVFSMTLLNAYGFFTLPDTPLLFFTALFLLVYKKFIEKPSFVLGLVLGVIMAALMYSKYHAVLVIFFVLLSNLKLVLNKYAWLAVITALLCYSPHFLWLYDHDYISIKYHLFERPNAPYNFNKYTLGFLVNLVAIFGLTFPFVYYALAKSRAKDHFTKALLYLTYGVLIFFFISSFNRRVQTQWIIVVSIPMAILVFSYMLEHENIRKWLFRLALINIAIILILRIGLIYEPLFPIHYETHGNKAWMALIQSKAGDNPVVFENSYRNAPMYAFYTGKTSYSLNNINYRQNQYSIDNSEEAVQHKKVLYISKYLDKKDIAFPKDSGSIYYGMFMDDFESFRKLRCIVEDEKFELNDQRHVVKLYNPYDQDIALKKLKFAIAYLNEAKQFKELVGVDLVPENAQLMHLSSNDSTLFTFKLPKPKKTDAPKYFKIVISENGLRYGLNSKTIKLD
ncbi:ArnT family glycosyltransferase [Maribacter polysiphoniae]|uniref:ArnT family glycosyltransferase n=1 Tax=Maribacter polysiphoniae TaxID=429344 RepID=UPI00235761BE|nr:glycosyltransferase family 39 protein [Maribacter polysiphoniae]